MLNKIHKGVTLDVLKSIPKNIVDLIVTSPPYNKKITNSGKNSIMKPITYDSIGDNMDESDYQQDQINVLNARLKFLLAESYFALKVCIT